MCVNYYTEPKARFEADFGLQAPEEDDWPDDVWADYRAPIIIDRGQGPHAVIGTYGMIPKKKLPPKVRFSTLNARSETASTLKSYRDAWNNGQYCLVPIGKEGFCEPCWETGHAEKWAIGMANNSAFAVAGLYREWKEENGRISLSFTQLTVNATNHPLMKRMHKPEDEKRSLVIIPPADYENWLSCAPEKAVSYMKLYSAELMAARNEGPYAKRTK